MRYTKMRTFSRLVVILILVPALIGRPQDALTHERDKVTVTLEFTLYGEVAVGEFHVGREEPAPGAVAVYCGPQLTSLHPDCDGSDEGNLYTDTFEVPKGTDFTYSYQRYNVRDAGHPGETYARGSEAIRADTTISAYFDYRTMHGGPGKGPSRQLRPAVIKTFKLTLRGDVPEDEAFDVRFTRAGEPEWESHLWGLCSPKVVNGVGGPPCESWKVHVIKVDFPAGTTLSFEFRRRDPATRAAVGIRSGTEVLDTDTTNNVLYDFSGEQQDGERRSVPDKLPNTGAGGLEIALVTLDRSPRYEAE